MTENQKLLLPYVEARTNDVINDKTSRGIFPLLATEPEIIADIRGDVLECMREPSPTKSIHRHGNNQ